MAYKKDKKPRREKKIIVAKNCYFTETGTKPDYKEILVLRRFINERGKIFLKNIVG